MGLFDRLFGKREPAGRTSGASAPSWREGDNVVGVGMATDPVCHMQVDTQRAPGGTSTHGAQTYYFCSPGCKGKFDADPHRYLGAHSH